MLNIVLDFNRTYPFVHIKLIQAISFRTVGIEKFSDKHCKTGTASWIITERGLTMIDEIYNSRIGAIKTYHFSDEWEKTLLRLRSRWLRKRLSSSTGSVICKVRLSPMRWGLRIRQDARTEWRWGERGRRTRYADRSCQGRHSDRSRCRQES